MGAMTTGVPRSAGSAAIRSLSLPASRLPTILRRFSASGPGRLAMTRPSFITTYRQDITEGRSGLPLTLILTIVKVNHSCAALTNASVQIWQCDAAGTYSEYGTASAQTFLRGLQTTDNNGVVTFRTIYPGWYQGRATHIHLQVFVNGAAVKTTQIAFPEDVSADVYRTATYASHGQNSTTNSRDNVFADGIDHELAALAGDTTTGYTATLTVGVAV
jgi:protocatechuate 3,4-dioxygenase beta subunit